MCSAGVVDQDVDASHRLRSPRHEVVQLSGITHVDDTTIRAFAEPPNSGLHLAGVAGADPHHDPFGDEFSCDGEPEALGTSGDDRSPVVQTQIHGCPPSC